MINRILNISYSTKMLNSKKINMSLPVVTTPIVSYWSIKENERLRNETDMDLWSSLKSMANDVFGDIIG